VRALHAFPACSKLNLGLPYAVRHKDGDAKWDAASSTLAVRLPVIRADIFG